MFITLSIIAALQLANGLPDGASGIWTTSDNLVISMNLEARNDEVRLNIGAHHVSSYGIEAMLDGTFLGNFDSTRLYRVYQGGYQGLHSQNRNYVHAETTKPETETETGRIRIAFAGMNAGGRITGGHVWLADALNSITFSESVTRLTSLSKVSVQGLWRRDNVNLQISDEGGKIANITGTLSWGSKPYGLFGTRSATVAAFDLVDPSTNEDAGTGYIIWLPTSKCVSKMKESKDFTSDQIQLHFNPRDSTYPSGYDDYLSRG